MAAGWGVIGEAIANLVAATRGDVSEPLAAIAQRARDAELGDQNAFSEFLSDSVPSAIASFDRTAEGALSAAADFADALAEGVAAAHRAYEEADRRSCDELVRLTEDLR
ncbi:hypothetical protein [Glycomyces paridis]|uniref:Uncharacterized protein n=1 Tax=Glycomyces paridis TaxID=2126555 RepID=A0A4V4HPJ9_9ACTN|nr:hypothetical protein [Glycomyces paridis]THV30236.1 hypothetical protein E9998_07670 [Glycomyces paridis]